MKPEYGRPDPMPPGVRRLFYWGFCWMNRHPRVWRAIGATWRFWPFLSRFWALAARRSAVKHVLTRPRSFSNTSHTANLIAGDFLIGMDPGTTYNADRALFASILDRLDVKADADRESRLRIAGLKARTEPPAFDLIDDYLMWVVFSAIKPAFGDAADGVVAASRTCPPDESITRHYLREIRYIAAHLFAGWLAPIDVTRRAEVNAASLRARIDEMTPELCRAWFPSSATEDTRVRRNAIGLAWVSHPVTAQSGALAFQELLGRPGVYADLRAKAGLLGEAVWTDSDFRKHVERHVLELMRFRPVFPLLARDVPRATEFDSGARSNPRCPAGSSVTALSISAAFDATGLSDMGQFCPQRDWRDETEIRYVMFGYGERRCPAKDQAVTMLTSAFIGLLTLPQLHWADRWGKRMAYDGPMISRMRLRMAQ